MSQQKRSNRTVRVLALAAIGVFVLAAVVAATVLPRQWLAMRWSRQLERLPDDEVPSRMEQLAALEEAGIPVLVEALGSDREIVADSARAVLFEQIERWSVLPAERSSRRAAVLARALAAHVDELHPAGQSAAVALAERLLARPASFDAGVGARMVADCEYVLRAATDASSDAPTDALARSNTKSSSENRAGESPRGGGYGDGGGELPGLPRLPSVRDVPGGNLPMEAALVPPLPAGLSWDDSDWLPTAEAPIPGTGSGPSRSGTVPRTLRPENARRMGPDDGSSPEHPAPPALLDSPGDEAPGTLPQVEADRLPEPDRAEVPSLDDLDRAVPLSIVALLRSGDERVVRAAAYELGRRGLTDDDLALAWRLSRADAENRRELVERLPRLGQIDVRRWLLWLSHDEDAGVRLAAVTVMATSRDPQLLDRLREMQGSESDPEVLRQLERLSAFRGEKSIR